jgi:DNA-binding beta-propeller fold protein YncE
VVVALAGCDDGAPPEGGVRVVGGPGRTDGLFARPRAVTTDSETIYALDKTYRIQLFDADGAWRATWPLEEIHRGYPSGMDIAPDGNLVVADTHNHRILFYNARGDIARILGRNGGGPGEFTYVMDVAFDRAGNLYACEFGRVERVQKFDPEGNFLRAWGEDGAAPGQFNRPQAVAVSPDDIVYVADAANHRVQIFDTEGNLLDILGREGDRPGEFSYPYDLAFDDAGRLYVCEYGNGRIQVFDGALRPIGFVGRPGRAPGEFASPYGVAWLGGGRIVVADMLNHRLQILRPSARVALRSGPEEP